MKSIRLYACMMLFAFSMVCMTGCNNRNNTKGTNPTTTTQQTTPATKAPTNSTSAGAGTTVEDTSPGVINGLINDVEEGVNNITGETTMNGTDNESVKETTQ